MRCSQCPRIQFFIFALSPPCAAISAIAQIAAHYSTSWTLCGFRYGGIILRYLGPPFHTACIDDILLGTNSSESGFCNFRCFRKADFFVSSDWECFSVGNCGKGLHLEGVNDDEALGGPPGGTTGWENFWDDWTVDEAPALKGVTVGAAIL